MNTSTSLDEEAGLQRVNCCSTERVKRQKLRVKEEQHVTADLSSPVGIPHGSTGLRVNKRTGKIV